MLLVTARRPAVQLTPRELEVVDLLGRGRTPKEIASELGISLHTVRGHTDSARLRFGARTIPELVLLLARARATRTHEGLRTA